MNKKIEEVVLTAVDVGREYNRIERATHIHMILIYILGFVNALCLVFGLMSFKGNNYVVGIVCILIFLGTLPPTKKQMYMRSKYLNMVKR